jgi:type II restriction enzyme
VPTARQALGFRGEKAVSERIPCPRCGRPRHLARLPTNFQCADLICKFCGFLAQVKAVTLPVGATDFPDRVLGAAWGPQHDQIMAGIFHGLYLVGFSANGRLVRIDYVPAHVLQSSPEVFEPRQPLRSTAKRAGWTGFY